MLLDNNRMNNRQLSSNQSSFNMEKLCLFCQVLSVVVVFASQPSLCFNNPDIATISFQNGRFGYFAVPKTRVAEKLKEVQIGKRCHSGSQFQQKLTLPSRPILPGILPPDQHLVAVIFGKLKTESLTGVLLEDLKTSYATEAFTVQLFIPFLSADPEEPAIYKMPLRSFVSTQKPFIQPNVMLATEQVDQLAVSDTGFTIQDGADRFSVSWSRLCSCEQPDDVIIYDFNKYLQELIVTYDNGASNCFCDEPDMNDVPLCQLRHPSPCECQYWISRIVSRCRADFFKLDEITTKFKELSLLTEDNRDAIMTEAAAGYNISVGLMTPCRY